MCEGQVIHTTRECVTRQGFRLPEGSGFYLERINKTSYYGLWCSRYGSFRVTVPMSACPKCPSCLLHPKNKSR